MEISKSDWKLFREKLPDWQENYVERLLKRYIKNLNDESKPASTKFWELEKQIKKDRRHPGVIMELEKSETVWNIVELLRKKVITQKELVDFSDDLQQEVKRIMDIRRGQFGKLGRGEDSRQSDNFFMFIGSSY